MNYNMEVFFQQNSFSEQMTYTPPLLSKFLLKGDGTLDEFC